MKDCAQMMSGKGHALMMLVMSPQIIIAAIIVMIHLSEFTDEDDNDYDLNNLIEIMKIVVNHFRILVVLPTKIMSYQ